MLVIVFRAAESSEPGKPTDTDVDVVVRSCASEFAASETCGAADWTLLDSVFDLTTVVCFGLTGKQDWPVGESTQFVVVGTGLASAHPSVTYTGTQVVTVA